MLTFDEDSLIHALNQLPAWKRVVFAAMCAERLFPSYLVYTTKTGRGNPSEFESLLDSLWSDLDGQLAARHEVEVSADKCIALIPGEDDGPWDESQVYAENAGTALAYALQCRRNGGGQEAAWAARHVYEALDYYVNEHGEVDEAMRGSDVRVISHPLVQGELLRQRRDIDRILRARGDTSEVAIALRPIARHEAKSLFDIGGLGRCGAI